MPCFSFRKYFSNLSSRNTRNDVRLSNVSPLPEGVPNDFHELTDLARRLHPGVPLPQVAEWLPKHISRRERALKAVEILEKHAEGLLWIKVHAADIPEVGRSACIVPINWTRRNLSETKKRETLNADYDDDVCVLCFDRKANVELGPCKHDKFCSVCIMDNLCGWTRGIPTCPICRGSITSFVHLVEMDDIK